MKFKALFVLAPVLALLAVSAMAEDSLDTRTIPVRVDYTKSLERLIRDSHYDWIVPGFPKEFDHDPGYPSSDTIVVDVVLVRLVKIGDLQTTMTSEQVLAELDKLDLRPATFRELLALGGRRKKLESLAQKYSFSIVALGSTGSCYGEKKVAAMFYRGISYKKHGWDLFAFGLFSTMRWSSIDVFAAVRK